MNRLSLSLYLFLAAATALVADVPAVEPGAADPLAEALPILQSGYIDFPSLHYRIGDRLSDLIARSAGRIQLDPPEITPPLPILTAALPGGIIYWRLASFTPKKDWADLAGDLREMIESQHAVGAILDLRSNSAPDDYAGAAQVLSFFVPADTALDKYLPQKNDGFVHLPLSNPGPEFQGPLVVLTNGQTAGAAETLAARLKADGALVFGRATAEAPSFVEEDKLASGQILRFAIAPTSPAGGAPPSGYPVLPDVDLTVDDHAEKGALVLIRDNHIGEVIQEAAERRRLSEATLVQGDDPELDDYLTSLEKHPNSHFLLSLPPIHDVVLTSAIDSLKAIRVSLEPAPAQPSAGIPTPASASVQ